MQELTPCPTKCLTRHFSIILYFRELTEKLRVLFDDFHFLSVRNETPCDRSWLNELAERSCVFYGIQNSLGATCGRDLSPSYMFRNGVGRNCL